MAARLFGAWRMEWRLRRGAASYVAALFAEPDDEDVRWLSGVATSGDDDRARWELRYARRALGLLVAERDALDDRTGSIVARQVREALKVDRNVAAGMVRTAERQLDDRLAAYRKVLMARSADEATGARLGRALLTSAGGARHADPRDVERAGGILAQYIGASNVALRNAFGEVVLPEDRPPSAVFGTPRT